MFKPFEVFKSASKLQTSKIYAALYMIDRALESLQLPDVEGVPLLSIGTHNVNHDGSGNIVVEVDILQEQVQIGSMYIRDNVGALEKSTDGVAWTEIGSGGADMMSKVIYDTDDDGIVEQAKELFDGDTKIHIANITSLQTDTGQNASDIAEVAGRTVYTGNTSTTIVLRLPGGRSTLAIPAPR